MICVWCGGYVPLAIPRGSETFCVQCGRGFTEAHDYGFFDYTAEVYAPKPGTIVPTSGDDDQ